MQNYYFDIEKVESITLTHQSETNYKWFEETPSSPKIFLGFKIGVKPAIPAGWSHCKDEQYRTSTSYFKGYDWYKVDETNKKIWNKACVHISLGYKRYNNTYFNSNEEAQKYVDKLILDSTKNFQVIVKG
jgi:hypothetical protein